MKLSNVWRASFWLAALLLGGCEQAPETTSSSFLAFGTLTEVQVSSPRPAQAREAIHAVEADFRKMHRDWHAWQTGPLTRTNAAIASGERFLAPKSVRDLISRSLPLAIDSEHRFNPAIGRLIALWGFHGNNSDTPSPPPREQIRQLLDQAPRLTDLVLDGEWLSSRNPAVSLDFGAIGKGHGIDLAMDRLASLGMANAVVNSGGDLKVSGSKAGRPWRIAIRAADGSNILGFVENRGTESFFTSGDYERNFTGEGKRYHHIIDPATGYPARGSRSVTVIHPQALVADAAATALFVAGPEHWYRIARKIGIQYVLLVDRDGRLHMNPKMRERLQLATQNHVIVMSDPL